MSRCSTAVRRTAARLATALCAAMLILGSAAPSRAQDSPSAITIAVSRAVFRQGETFRLTLKASDDLKSTSVRFAGRTWPLYVTGPRTWLTILGVDPTMPLGKQAVTVEAVTSSDVVVRARREITVTKVAFPSRRVTFDPAIQKLVTPEAVARERHAVREAQRVRHPDALWEGPLLVPVEGRISSPYGVLSIYQGRVSGFHGGTDIAAEAGTPVKAAGRGIVRWAEAIPLSGNTVMIDHGWGVLTAYMHMQEIRVTAGQRVEKGDIVGLVGTTGLSTGPHLHWGLRVNGVNVDPMPWAK